MYLRGLGQDYEGGYADDYGGDALPASSDWGYYGGAVVTSAPGPVIPGSNVDWGNLVATAMKTWGTVHASDNQLELEKARIATQGRYYSTLPPYGVQYPAGYPFPGSGGSAIFGIPTEYLLIGAAALAAVFMLSSDKR